MARKGKKQTWFDRGAQALARVEDLEVPGGEQYVCPHCLGIFSSSEIGLLTIEDVPPRSLGGRPLVLTCERCNSGSGSELDVHAAHLDRMERFASGRAGGFLPTRLSIGDAAINVSTPLQYGYYPAQAPLHIPIDVQAPPGIYRLDVDAILQDGRRELAQHG